MLTVIGQQAVAVFADSGTRSAHHFGTIEARRRLGSDPERMSMGELRQRNVFHRSCAQATREASVLHDSALPHINAVMHVASAWRNDVRT